MEIFGLWGPFPLPIASPRDRPSCEFAKTFAPPDLADFLLSSWQGAMLRMNVDRSDRPLELFKQIIFATAFGGEK